MPVNFSKNLGMDFDGQSKLSSNNALFEVGLLLVICGLFTWFIILPKRAEISQKQSALQDVTTKESGIADKVKALDAKISSLENSSDKIRQLDEALPLDGDVIKPRLLLEKMASDANVTVGNISVTAKPGSVAAGNTDLLAHPYDTTRSLQTLSAAVYVLGSFQQLQTFLQEVEQSGRLMNVSGLAIAQDSQGQLSMKLTMDIYYLAP
jgi:Tfp pilus assembly protein PilO